MSVAALRSTRPTWRRPCDKVRSPEPPWMSSIASRSPPIRPYGQLQTCLSRPTPRASRRSSGFAITSCFPRIFAASCPESPCTSWSTNTADINALRATVFVDLDFCLLRREHGTTAHTRSPPAEDGRSRGRFQHSGALARIQVTPVSRGAYRPAEDLSRALVRTSDRAWRLDPNDQIQLPLGRPQL